MADTDSKSVEQLLQEGSTLLASDPATACDRASRVLELRPNHPLAQNLLGLGMLARSKAGRARDLFEALIRRNPDVVPLRINAGVAALDSGELDAAVEHFHRAVDLAPTHSRGFGYLALAHLRRKEVNLARAALREAGLEALADQLDGARPEGLTHVADELRASVATLPAPGPTPLPHEGFTEAGALPEQPGDATEIVAELPDWPPADRPAPASPQAEADAPAAEPPAALPADEDLDRAFDALEGGPTDETEIGPADATEIGPTDATEIGSTDATEIEAELPAWPAPATAAPLEPADETAPEAETADETDRAFDALEAGPTDETEIEAEPPAWPPEAGVAGAGAPRLGEMGTDRAAEPLVAAESAGEEQEFDQHRRTVKELVAEPPPSRPPPEAEPAPAPPPKPAKEKIPVVAPRLPGRTLQLSATGPEAQLDGPTLVLRLATSQTSAGVVLRRDQLMLQLGAPRWAQALRRRKGASEGPFLCDGIPVALAEGDATVVLHPGAGQRYYLFQLERSGLYLRARDLAALSDRLYWENGRIPQTGDEGPEMVAVRGSGFVAARCAGQLWTIPTDDDVDVTVRLDLLLGWRVKAIPQRIERIDGQLHVSFRGAGVLLLVFPNP
jgi:tetratricopeptide (TPR) repeat protein